MEILQPLEQDLLVLVNKKGGYPYVLFYSDGRTTTITKEEKSPIEEAAQETQKMFKTHDKLTIFGYQSALLDLSQIERSPFNFGGKEYHFKLPNPGIRKTGYLIVPTERIFQIWTGKKAVDKQLREAGLETFIKHGFTEEHKPTHDDHHNQPADEYNLAHTYQEPANH